MSEYYRPFELTSLKEDLRRDAVDGIGVRVSSKMAKYLLLNNVSLICGGCVFYLNIKNLGMGAYKVTKAPLSQKETKRYQEQKDTENPKAILFA